VLRLVAVLLVLVRQVLLVLLLRIQCLLVVGRLPLGRAVGRRHGAHRARGVAQPVLRQGRQLAPATLLHSWRQALLRARRSLPARLAVGHGLLLRVLGGQAGQGRCMG
jgi:hypothetical protein